MLQRIQTIYLLLVIAVCAVAFFIPTMSFSAPEAVYTLGMSGFSKMGENGAELIQSTLGLSLMTGIIPLIALITLNLYKKRPLQMRLCVFNMLLMLGYYGLLFFYRYMIMKETASDVIVNMEWPAIMPAVGIVLTYLAFRGIAKDEALVRSMDRIR